MHFCSCWPFQNAFFVDFGESRSYSNSIMNSTEKMQRKPRHKWKLMDFMAGSTASFVVGVVVVDFFVHIFFI